MILWIAVLAPCFAGLVIIVLAARSAERWARERFRATVEEHASRGGGARDEEKS